MLRHGIQPAAVALALILAACAPATGPTFSSGPAPAGLAFLPRTAEKGTVFKYYQPKGESAWRNNWTRRLDFSGVSWNDARTATLISPSHVVMAAHFPRPSNVPVMFHDVHGKPCERYLTAVKAIPGTDVAVGRLNLPVAPGIKVYPFARANPAPGTPVIVTDQTRSVSVHEVEVVFGHAIRLRHVTGLNPVYQRNLIVGDSGNPSFLLERDGLHLLETHTTGGPGAGPFYGAPSLQASIRAAMAELGN